MAIPIYNASTTIAGNGNFLTIIATDVSQQSNPYPLGTQGRCEMIDIASYYINVSALGTSITITFQELGADGIWRSLVLPAPITTAATFNGIVNGPFHGLRINVSNFVGATVSYAEIKGTVRTN